MNGYERRSSVIDHVVVLEAEIVLVSAAAAVMLTACSSDMDRFASNPSGADPVYTASVPKNVNASNVGMADTGVASKPLASASSQPPSYDYSKSYQAPQYRQPAAQPQVSASAPAGTRPDSTMRSCRRWS